MILGIMNDASGLLGYRSSDETAESWWCKLCEGTQATHVIEALNSRLHLCEFHYIKTCAATSYKPGLPYYVCTGCNTVLRMGDAYGRDRVGIVKCYDRATCRNCWDERKMDGEELLWVYRNKHIMHGFGSIIGRYVELFL